MKAVTLAPDAPVDLQLHTDYSDGTWAPAQLIDYLLQAGFALAAITDHDRADTAASLQQLAHRKGFFLLPAVELSTRWRGELVDLLCYGFEPAAPALCALTDQLWHRQRENVRETVKQVNGQRARLPGTAVQAILDKPAVQQPFALVGLARREGYDSPERPAGRRLVEAGLRMVTVALADAVAEAHRDGGVCLLAHPGRGDGFLLFGEALLDQLRAEVPIDGLEVYYPAHSAEQVACYREYATKHGLLASAGSDSHSSERLPVKYRAELCSNLWARLGIAIR